MLNKITTHKYCQKPNLNKKVIGICLILVGLHVILILNPISAPSLVRFLSNKPSGFFFGLLEDKRRYDDAQTRIYEKSLFVTNNESEYYAKKNTWHPTKVGIVSDPWSLCTHDYGSNLDLFVYLWTRPSWFQLRRVVRRTWANRTLFPRMNVAFVLGLTMNSSVDSRVEKENQKYGDILLGDFLDTYRNLSFKSLIAWRWIKYNCMKASYFLKMDVSLELIFFFS